MNVKKIAKKIVALGAGAGLVGMTLMSALAAPAGPDLANYPDFVMSGGQFDGKLVLGSDAQMQDLLGAIDIAASLQAASTTTVAVGDGAASSTVISGDAKKIADSGDILELGEDIGSVLETVTDDDLEMLQSGRAKTQKGTTDYNQILELNSASTTMVGYYENHDDESGYFLFFDDGEDFFNYELEFTSGLESDIDGTTAEDFEDESIFMLGQQYSIVTATVDSVLGSELTLELIAGDVVDVLSVGQTKTYEVDGVDYEVTVLIVGNSGEDVKFLVNGEVTDSMGVSDTETLSSGLEIGVREIIETTQYLESQPGSIVEFYLGANKIIFEDTNVATATGGSVEINNENIEDATLNMYATFSGDTIRLNRIEYALASDADYKTDIYVAEEEGVRQYLDEPEGMLNAQWDIMFAGVSKPSTTMIIFDPQGDDEYELQFENKNGDEITVPFLYTNSDSSVTKTGDEDDDLVFWEIDGDGSGDANQSADFNIALDSYFVLTDVGADTTADNADNTYVLQFNDVDTDDETLTFTNLGDDGEITATYTAGNISNVADPATGTIQVGGKNFDFWVYDSGSGAYKLAVDLNDNGNLTDGNMVDIVTKGGGIISFDDYDLSDDELNVTFTVLAEDVDSDVEQAVLTSFTAGSGEVDLNVDSTAVSGTLFSEDVNGEDRTVSVTKYGTMFDETDETDNADSLEITHPLEQVEALVYVVGGDVETSISTTGGSTADRINVLPVGLGVLDVDVIDDSYNMIVVGGPCANTVAFDLMELGPETECTEGFEPGMGMINTYDTGDNVAILVAGYSATDTVQTSQVLAEAATGMVDNLEGSKAEVVIAGANDITVRTAAD